jgi:hypothetical protein
MPESLRAHRAALAELIAGERDLCTCCIIVAEIFQGLGTWDARLEARPAAGRGVRFGGAVQTDQWVKTIKWNGRSLKFPLVS